MCWADFAAGGSDENEEEFFVSEQECECVCDLGFAVGLSYVHVECVAAAPVADGLTAPAVDEMRTYEAEHEHDESSLSGLLAAGPADQADLWRESSVSA